MAGAPQRFALKVPKALSTWANVEKAAENYATGSNVARATELRFKLADYYLARQDEAAARTHYKAVETMGLNATRSSYDVHMPAMSAGTTPWFEGAVRLSIDALINGQPRGY